jgi:NADH-quinone oxidoreductase subunit H
VDLISILIVVAKVAFVLIVVLHFGALMTWAERKQAALIQDRIGPNRINILGVKALGLIQIMADGLKMIMKEDFIPAGAHRLYHTLAPAIAMFPALVALAVVPFGPSFDVAGRHIELQVANLDVGILFVLAVSSLGVYGIALAGWASNNKYSLLGTVRATAQMISYEIPMGLAIIGIVMTYGTLEMNKIVELQGEYFRLGGLPILPKWGIFYQPLGFVLLFTALIAETKRTPFDLPEGESELVAGFNVEYSGMKWGMFFLGEFASIVVVSALVATLYFGGWQIPYVNLMALPALPRVLLGVATFFGKVIVLCWLQLLVRWTLPRFRYDQLMDLGWKRLMPLAIANLPLTAAWIWMLGGMKS